MRVARAALVAGAIVTAAVGAAPPAHATVQGHDCSPVHNGFYACIDNSTWYRLSTGNTTVLTSLHASTYTDYRIHVLNSAGAEIDTYLIYPGEQLTREYSGRQTLTVCATEATLGKTCTQAVTPYTSNA